MERRNTSQSLAGHTAPLCLANGVRGKSRLSTSSVLASIWGSLPFISMLENSWSPSAEMCACPGKVLLHLSPASPLDSLLAPRSLLVLPSHCSCGGEQHGETDCSCRTSTPRLCYVQSQLFTSWVLLQTSAGNSTETSIIGCLHQGE